jgi:hypothetical protein
MSGRAAISETLPYGEVLEGAADLSRATGEAVVERRSPSVPETDLPDIHKDLGRALNLAVGWIVLPRHGSVVTLNERRLSGAPTKALE